MQKELYPIEAASLIEAYEVKNNAAVTDSQKQFFEMAAELINTAYAAGCNGKKIKEIQNNTCELQESAKKLLDALRDSCIVAYNAGLEKGE